MERKKKHNYRREAVLQAVREIERVISGLFEVLGNEVSDEDSKKRLVHFSRGCHFVLHKIRELP